MESKIRKLLIRTVTCFTLIIAIWIIICLAAGTDSTLGKALCIFSLIPCGCYIIYGIKLFNALGMGELYTKLYR